MTMLFALVIFGAAIASLFVSGWLWKRLREQHRRQHQYSLSLTSLGEQVAHLSRAAARAEVRARLGERGAAAEPHAQHGEEFFLWERCGFKPNGVFIEIGAYDGVAFSNSLFFEQIGWRGLLVEAHPDLAVQCRQSRPKALVVHAALGDRDGGEATFSMVRGARGLDTLSYASTNDRHRQRISAKGGTVELVAVPARTLRSLVTEYELADVDWLSIDVEGAEFDVLNGAGLSTFRPRLLLIEDNSAGKDSSVRDYLQQFGYVRVLTVGCNDLYERSA